MAIDLTVAAIVHLVVAALWTGSVVFFTWTVLDAALSGTLDAEPFGAAAAKLVWLSRVSALTMLLTGGHLAGRLYTVERLTGTDPGHLVLTMVALWLLLTALVEISASRIRRGTDELNVREPARRARLPLYAATAVALALLVDAGLLMAP